VLLHGRQPTGGSRPSASLNDDDDDEAAETRGNIGSHGPSPVSQSPASFHESWLYDPLHPLGGGSSLAAALGQDAPGSGGGGWATQISSGPRSRGRPADPVPEEANYREEHDGEGYVSPWAEAPGRADPGVSSPGQVHNYGLLLDGDALTEAGP